MVGRTNASGGGGASFTANVPASGWSSGGNGEYINTVTVSGIKTSYTIFPDLALTGLSLVTVGQVQEAWAHVYMATCVSDNQIKFFSDALPKVNIPVKIFAFKG